MRRNKMANKCSVALLSMILAACATPGQVDVPELKRMSVTQGAAEYVACNGCQGPTQKTVRLVPAKPKDAPVKPAEPVVEIVSMKVHFRWGWGVLDADGRKEVQAVIAQAAKGSSVEVLGHTDPTGNKEFNQRLAQKRAETVRKALVTAGIPAGLIVAGTHEPCCAGNLRGGASVHKELRRTDVEITIKTKKS